ncbi:MAG: NRDE family protein [Proteobacteria bacterium]|nr:NRDE family protein [Pseudomonadota bacterium]
MCLIAWNWQPGTAQPLLLAANRDEWLDRPTLPMRWWRPDPTKPTEILSGRDLRSGGIWLGFTRSGRFAAVTNVRDPGLERPLAPSRGLLALRFLLEQHPKDGTLMPDCAPSHYAAAAQLVAHEYAGFNLLLGDMARSELMWLSNHPASFCRVEPGVHGLSNAALDTPWPKVRALRAALAQQARQAADGQFAALEAALTDQHTAPDAQLPRTGVTPVWERALSAAFIRVPGDPGYGTRCSTLLRTDSDSRIHVREVQHQPAPAEPADFIWNRHEGD